MKAKTLFLLLLAMALMSGGVARQRVFSVSGRVIDTSGEGVEGVVVNNGRQFTQTDQDGRWSLLTDTLVSKYISISTPADFCLPAAAFHRFVHTPLCPGQSAHRTQAINAVPRPVSLAVPPFWHRKRDTAPAAPAPHPSMCWYFSPSRNRL